MNRTQKSFSYFLTIAKKEQLAPHFSGKRRQLSIPVAICVICGQENNLEKEEVFSRALFTRHFPLSVENLGEKKK